MTDSITTDERLRLLRTRREWRVVWNTASGGMHYTFPLASREKAEADVAAIMLNAEGGAHLLSVTIESREVGPWRGEEIE